MISIKDIEKKKENIINKFKNIKNLEEAENLRIKYLSRKGEIPEMFSLIKEVIDTEKKAVGQILNSLKIEAFEILNNFKGSSQKEKSIILDTSIAGRRPTSSKLHPLDQVQEDLKRILRQMGFSVAKGPELETEYYIFDALNMPSWHPARKKTDSLYVKDNLLLRTETSSVQIRIMEAGKPPFRIISPGKVYRNEKENATHSAMFFQCEGLYIDENVSFAELKGTLRTLFNKFFNTSNEIRFRPHFFPFTEPSAEVDASCFQCQGSGCPLCKNSGWIELGGCGMVDPSVLQGVGIDTEKYSGYAFGLGIDRLAMLKYGVTDIRNFYENDLRFLKQF